MEYDKRKFKRYDIPIILQFRPEKETDEYSWGLVKDISYEGFSFESLSSDHKPKENLELKLKFPQRRDYISLLGDVVWKIQGANKCLSGIKLQEMNKEDKGKYLEKISAHGNIPAARFLYKQEALKEVEKKEEKTGAKLNTAENIVEKPLKNDVSTGLTKEYFDNSNSCRVIFKLSKNDASNAQKISIPGDFNGWNKEATFMKRLESGDFIATIEIKSGMEYRYRYLIDDIHWVNDSYADNYESNSFGSYDSVVIV